MRAMNKEVEDGIIFTMSEKLLDVCNSNQLNIKESCACVAAATHQALYSIFRSVGINDRDEIKEYINKLLQITIDFNNKHSGLDSHS